MELTRRLAAPAEITGAMEIVKALLQGKCEWLSSVMKATVTRKAVTGLLLSCPLLATGLWLVSDGVREYFWGLLLILVGWQLVRPLVHDLKSMED